MKLPLHPACLAHSASFPVTKNTLSSTELTTLTQNVEWLKVVFLKSDYTTGDSFPKSVDLVHDNGRCLGNGKQNIRHTRDLLPTTFPTVAERSLNPFFSNSAKLIQSSHTREGSIVCCALRSARPGYLNF